MKRVKWRRAAFFPGDRCESRGAAVRLLRPARSPAGGSHRATPTHAPQLHRRNSITRADSTLRGAWRAWAAYARRPGAAIPIPEKWVYRYLIPGYVSTRRPAFVRVWELFRRAALPKPGESGGKVVSSPAQLAKVTGVTMRDWRHTAVIRCSISMPARGTRGRARGRAPWRRGSSCASARRSGSPRRTRPRHRTQAPAPG